jgi:hypothetical protein
MRDPARQEVSVMPKKTVTTITAVTPDHTPIDPRALKLTDTITLRLSKLACVAAMVSKAVSEMHQADRDDSHDDKLALSGVEVVADMFKDELEAISDQVSLLYDLKASEIAQALRGRKGGAR